MITDLWFSENSCEDPAFYLFLPGFESYEKILTEADIEQMIASPVDAGAKATPKFSDSKQLDGGVNTDLNTPKIINGQ